MNKGIKQQIIDLPIIKKESGITRQHIKEAVEYVFRNNPDKKDIDSNLYITDNEDYLSFKYGTFTTGLEGFKDIYKQGYGLGIKNVYYNGTLLNEEHRKEIFNKLFKE